VDVIGIALGLALYRWVVSRVFATRALPRDQVASPSP
jgi:hypothetical protein